MNSKIIEVIGPPGIGKSTIYGSLCKTWRPISNWIHQDALLTPKPKFSEINKWINYRCRKILGKKQTKSISIDFGLRFIRENQRLAEFCWQHLSDTYRNALDKRFRSAYLLFCDFSRYQAILESSSCKPCIINEGLLQKSFFIDGEESIQSMINSYFSLLPLPYAVININTQNKDLIVERIQNRRKVIASHFEKDKEDLLIDIKKWQLLQNTMIEIMQKSGVKVFNVDGEKPIEENVSLIIGKLNRMPDF